MNGPQGETAVGHLVRRVFAAWSSYNEQALLDCFLPDASYITSRGDRLQGRDAIGRYMHEVHVSVPDCMHTATVEDMQLRRVARGVFVAVLAGHGFNPVACARGEWASTITAVNHMGDEWFIASMQVVFRPQATRGRFMRLVQLLRP